MLLSTLHGIGAVLKRKDYIQQPTLASPRGLHGEMTALIKVKQSDGASSYKCCHSAFMYSLSGLSHLAAVVQR